MLRFVTAALGAVLVVTGCSKSTLRSQEGQACSTDPGDDPQLICTPAQDLVCIATYSRTVTNPKEAGKFDGGIRQVYVCRLACDNNMRCVQPGDVCCFGTIFGKTYNKKGACAPPSQCEMGMVEDDDDAGAPPGDTGAGADRPADTTGAVDAGAPDGGGAAADAGGGA
jgi:hypothetical protein